MKPRDYVVLCLGGAGFMILGPAVMTALACLGNESCDLSSLSMLNAAPGVFLIAAGLVLTVLSVHEMIKVGRGGPAVLGPIKLNPETKQLVTTGPYRLCRNPMHLGILMYLAGWAFILSSLLALAIPLLMLIFAWFLAVVVDEPRLKRDFGMEFEVYKAQTPRFLPAIKKRAKV